MLTNWGGARGALLPLSLSRKDFMVEMNKLGVCGLIVRRRAFVMVIVGSDNAVVGYCRII